MKPLIALCCASGLALAPAFGEVKLSEKLTRIAGHLGEGGVHFSVTDAENDLKGLAALGDKLIGIVPNAEIPPNLRIEQLFADLGLFSYQGRGSSASRMGDLWHNRSFILTDGKHEGLFSLLGGESANATASDFAPAGADLVLETTVDLREVERTSRKISKAFGPEADSQVVAAFEEEVTELGISLADLFADFTVRGTLVVWLDEEKTFEAQPDVNLPVPHVAARLENGGTIWKLLKPQLEGDSTMIEKDGEVTVTPASGPVPTPFGEVTPIIVWNEKSKELFMALTVEDLAVCRGDGPRLSASESYKAATGGFPEKVTSLAYLSGDFFRLVESLANEFAPQAPEESQAVIKEVLPYLAELGTDGGYATGIAIEKDGFLALANLPFPIKGESSLMGPGGLFGVAMLAGLATPAIVKAQSHAEKAQVINNLKNLGHLMIMFQSEHDRYPKSLAELERASDDPGLFQSGVFDEVELAELKGDVRADTILAYQEVPDLHQVVMLQADGSVMSIPSEIFFKKLQDQQERE